MVVINVPIEPLEERYSAQWLRWFTSFLKKLEEQGIRTFNILPPYEDAGKITEGEFLDIYGTICFKARQVEALAKLLKRLKQEGDSPIIIIFNDGWFPVQMVRYVVDLAGMSSYTYFIGMFHAGHYDPNDFLGYTINHEWILPFEESLFDSYDLVLVATQFHKYLLTRSYPNAKVEVVFFPIYPEEFVQADAVKENIVVFPHRLAPEKNPEMFDAAVDHLKTRYPTWSFLKTKEVCQTKQEYYALLNTAKISVSTAYQETWGIAMLESTFCGCVPVVPRRLSYVELYPDKFKYNGTLEALVAKISDVIENYESYDSLRQETSQKLAKEGKLFFNRLENLIYKIKEDNHANAK